MAESPGDRAFPDLATILERARRIGESSWRAGIALGVEPAELERIERHLDHRVFPDGHFDSTADHAAADGALRSASDGGASPAHRLNAEQSESGRAADQQQHLAP